MAAKLVPIRSFTPGNLGTYACLTCSCPLLMHHDGDFCCREVPNERVHEALLPRLAGEQISYERLETLGDAALKMIVSLQLFLSYPLAHEGVILL